jgi:hypothetical protein
MAPRACLFVEPLMIDLTSVPATQNPSSPMMVCTTTMAVVTAATDGDHYRHRSAHTGAYDDDRGRPGGALL